jgi:adenine-specific DNA-methyltransferase
MTTAAITLLRRGRRRNEPVRFCSVSGVRALNATTLRGGIRKRPADLAPGVKWTPLFGESKAASGAGRTLGDVAYCMRGIATGANTYFALRESDRCQYGIDLRDLLVCITKAQQIEGDRLTRRDVKRLIDADQRIYLLHPRSPVSSAVKRYLAEGRRRGIDQRYLPSHRPVWYMPEKREPAPILVSVFARGRFRFVLNTARVLNLTAYHGIYLRSPSRTRVQALYEYLTRPRTGAVIRRHQRIYADGLLKLEPRDVEALPVPARVCDEA